MLDIHTINIVPPPPSPKKEKTQFLKKSFRGGKRSIFDNYPTQFSCIEYNTHKSSKTSYKTCVQLQFWHGYTKVPGFYPIKKIPAKTVVDAMDHTSSHSQFESQHAHSGNIKLPFATDAIHARFGDVCTVCLLSSTRARDCAATQQIICKIIERHGFGLR